jgi:hypothetical protein
MIVGKDGAQIPETDEDVRTLFSEVEDSVVLDTLMGLYHLERDRGKSVVNAYLGAGRTYRDSLS